VLDELKRAGLMRYHHNLEAAESYWPRVCTTRPYAEQRRVVADAVEAGLEVCSGGIFGMGESLDQRIELLDELRALDVDSIAINFFTPIPGTPFAELDPITPLECLRVVIAARMMMPRRDVRVCGGRERNVRDLQALLLLGGASGLMIGGYLTTPGRSPRDDLAMIRDLGFVPDAIPEGRETVSVNDPEGGHA
jgi:biotin synthase